MATEVKTDDISKMDIWNDLDTDSAEVKIQKKQERLKERKRISMILGLVLSSFSPAFIATFYYIGNTEPLEKLKPGMYTLSSVGCICLAYSFDYIVSYDIKSEWNKLMNDPPFGGPAVFFYASLYSCFAFSYYWHNNDESYWYAFKFFSVLSLILLWMSYDGLKKFFS
jgi:hypothetical protein